MKEDNSIMQGLSGPIVDWLRLESRIRAAFRLYSKGEFSAWDTLQGISGALGEETGRGFEMEGAARTMNEQDCFNSFYSLTIVRDELVSVQEALDKGCPAAGLSRLDHSISRLNKEIDKLMKFYADTQNVHRKPNPER